MSQTGHLVPYQGTEYLAAIGRWEPHPDPLLHLDPYRPPWLYRWGLLLAGFLVLRLFHYRVEGAANVPEPPYIIASNHQRWFDPIFIALAFPRQPMIYSMAKRETVFNRGWKRNLARRFGVFPISPSHGQLDLTGVASVYQVLARRGVVLIFPEGRYSRGGQLMPLKTGVAHFALQAGVPICPVAIVGLDRLRLFSPVTVSIGRAIHPAPPGWWSAQRRVRAVVERVRRAILHLIPPGLRGRPRIGLAAPPAPTSPPGRSPS